MSRDVARFAQIFFVLIFIGAFALLLFSKPWLRSSTLPADPISIAPSTAKPHIHLMELSDGTACVVMEKGDAIAMSCDWNHPSGLTPDPFATPTQPQKREYDVPGVPKSECWNESRNAPCKSGESSL